MHVIDKRFEFCYGHRVWNQSLREGFATDLCLACRHLHGHQGTIHIFLEAEELTDGMVTDFKHLGWFKKWLDDVLDHKFIMDLNDPLLDHELGYINAPGIIKSLDVHPEGYYTIKNPHSWYSESSAGEKLEGMVFVEFVPTSENLSKWIHKVVQDRMSKIGVVVSKVEFYETPKSRAMYLPN